MRFRNILALGLLSVLALATANLLAADSKVESKDPPASVVNGREDKITDQGTVVGTVKLVGGAAGKAFVDVTSVSGKTARYVPEWKQHGQDADTVKTVKSLHVGDKVSVEWYVNDHLRIKSIKALDAK